MKKEDENISEDDMRPEYDFSKMKDGIQGKYATRFKHGSNIIRLEPDVAEVFTNDASVNEALRSLIKLAKSQVKPTPH
jgi:hypothetical protein